ncbi:DNA polymerase IV [Chryseobacterium sp. A301]
MDAFYASVEQHDFPELRNRPLCVGSEERGVVVAASYEARKFGIHSAMPSKRALEKCPGLLFVPPRFERYKEISQQIRSIFKEYTDLVEPLSLDEAYLDVTENKKGIDSAKQIAREIRAQILEKTGLTASAGISINKFLAKVASDYHKPNGQKTIHPDKVLEFLETLPIERFHGIGKVTANRMHELHIYTGEDLRKHSVEDLTHYFGKSGLYFYNAARGIHHAKVNANRITKSIGVEDTFYSYLSEDVSLKKELQTIAQKLFERTSKRELRGKTLTLKIKYNDFSQFTRSRTSQNFYLDTEEILSTALHLWQLRPFDKPIRLLGLSLSNFENREQKSTSVQLKIPYDLYP